MNKAKINQGMVIRFSGVALLLICQFFHLPVLCAKPSSVYTITGNLHYESFGARIVAIDEHFIIAVSNCTWAITTIPSDNTNIASYKQLYDGRTLTSVTHFKKYKFNDAFMSVEYDDVPNSNISTFAAQLWVAFASQCYFSNWTNGLVEMAWFVNKRLRANHFKTQAVWRVQEQWPYLPVELNYFFDLKSFQQAQGEGAHLQAPKEDESSKLWASYNVTEFTNISSYTFPLAFKYEQYEPMAKTDRSQPFLVYKITGLVSNIDFSIADDAESIGLGKLRTVAEDSRFTKGTNSVMTISYVITNQALPSTNNPVLQRAYHIQSKIEAKQESHISPLIIRSILFAIMISVSVLFFVSIRKQRK